MIANQIKNTFLKLKHVQTTPVISFNFCSNNNNNNNNSNSSPYIHKENYNFEQYRKYTKKVNSALKEKKEREQVLAEADPIDLLPRRKRRQYDRPKYDLDISNYGAWRIFEGGLIKNHENGYPVVCKITCSPKNFQKVFGKGTPESKNNGRATREYNFQDVNYDYFLVYDWKATTNWHGKNLEDYDYENQEHIYPRNRLVKYPTEEEFWESEEPHQFRVNCSRYADFKKFQKWVEEELKNKSEGPSLDEIVIQKFGELNGYDNYDIKDYEFNHLPPVFKYDKTFWDAKQEPAKGKKDKKSKETTTSAKFYHDKITPAKRLSDQYLISEEQQQEQQSSF